MSYASISIDRRADYYARCAALIAADPLDFYTRAERGRKFQASRLNLRDLPAPSADSAIAASPATVAWLNSIKDAPCRIEAGTASSGGALAA